MFGRGRELAIYDTCSASIRDPRRFIAPYFIIDKVKNDALKVRNGTITPQESKRRSRNYRRQSGQIRPEKDTYTFYQDIAMDFPLPVRVRIRGGKDHPLGGMFLEITRLPRGEVTTTNMDKDGYEIRR